MASILQLIENITHLNCWGQNSLSNSLLLQNYLILKLNCAIYFPFLRQNFNLDENSKKKCWQFYSAVKNWKQQAYLLTRWVRNITHTLVVIFSDRMHHLHRYQHAVQFSQRMCVGARVCVCKFICWPFTPSARRTTITTECKRSPKFTEWGDNLPLCVACRNE